VPARRLMAVYGVWMATLVVLYYGFPSAHTYLWAVLGLSSAAAVTVGAIVNRPRGRVPWFLVALALLTLTIGDTWYNVLTLQLGQTNPFPSMADVFYLLMYPLLAAGLLLLPRLATGRDRAGLVDILIVTAGFGLLMWVFIISPNVHNQALTGAQLAIIVAYPLFDIVVLAVGARLITAVSRTPSVVLLAIGGLGLLTADVLYGLSQLHDTWAIGGPIDVGWIAFYSAWGAAALHPSMVTLTEPRVVRQSPVTTTRLVVLALAALIAPVVLGVEGAIGPVRDAHIIAVLSAVIFLLVLLRLAGVVRVNSDTLARERGLREAGAALVSATDSVAVSLAVHSAVASLLPEGSDHEVRLALKEDRAGARDGPVQSGADQLRARYVDTSALPAPAARAMARYDIVLITPLVVHDRPSGDPHIGDLLVATDEDALVALEGAVQLLAAQAALALERITLSNEITRRRSEEYFRTLVQNTADVILIVTDDDEILYASPSAKTLFGSSTLAGRQLRDLLEPDSWEQAHRVLTAVRGGGTGRVGTGMADWTVVTTAGGIVQVGVSCSDLRGDPTVDGLVITLRDVTEQRRLERELTHRANHDSLTGLANRVLFADRVQAAVDLTLRTGALVGVLFIDLDDFKVVNDTLGHEIGDQLLAAVGHRLSGALRANDMAARLGGDEFAILIEETVDPIDVEQVAERIVRILAEPIVLSGNLVNGSASIGVSTTIEAEDASDLLRQADLALYVAKGAGKSRWRRYQPEQHVALIQRLELRSALDQALAEGAFRLQYQPIVSLADGRTVGFEALLRWHHPTRGLLAPGEFIDVAEDSGLIVPIGDWVLARAMSDAARWSQVTGDSSTYLGVNVSARQFRAQGFVDKIRHELAASGLAPERVMLEITESLLLREDEQVWIDLTALREIGLRVAIDDFGTGYSALSYLRQVPIDVVKIDKSFIDSMSSSAQQKALVEGIVGLAQTLGLQVIAEGIQRPADRDLLVEIGCPLGQGFLYSSPLSTDDVVDWVRTEKVAA
jgi:diguanylate cyclase (GGDEF)-like protein/PAS domain S-box-containing protein